jgi:hypothetical protein
VYKVQLTKQTLGHNTDGQNQPQIFRGVANDPNRKGELFGVENLLKFKDGSFMSSLVSLMNNFVKRVSQMRHTHMHVLICILQWKASDNPSEEHDVADLAKELQNFNDDQLYDLAEQEDEGPKDTRKYSSDTDNGDSDIEFDANGINHGDLFCNTKGGAQIAQGDGDFDEEMGGESQIVEVATKIACEGIESEGDEEEDDVEEYGATPADNVPPESRSSTNPIPCPVKRPSNDADEALAVVDSTAKRSRNDRFERIANCGDDSDDEIFVIPAPFPGESSTNRSQQGVTEYRTTHVVDKHKRPENDGLRSSPDCISAKPSMDIHDEMSPDRSTCSYEGLRTQPTQTPKQSAPIKKKSALSKVSLMGTVFETSWLKDDQPAKKSGGLYIPSYSRK